VDVDMVEIVKLSKRGEYALRALIDLGMAREAGRELVQVQEIVEKENIPLPFLEQILFQLRAAGFVGAKRGIGGGYFLAKPMDSIPIGQIVRLIDGPLAPIRCVSQTAYEKCTCPDEEHCGLRMLMLDVRNSVAGILDRYTLADTINVTIRKLRCDNLPLPFEKALPKKLPNSRMPESTKPPKGKAPPARAKTSSRKARAA
jgi:Rrf2 family protein